jgi:predicted nucleotidyltransferase|tara:strand:+ start:1039 stop:1410 length:372 start_codon:yes stop_codon:yes gene_type:complete
MKTIFAAVASFVLFSAAVYVAAPAEAEANTSDSGVCVVEFNASFNASNSVDWLDDLSDCKGKRVDIATQPDMQKEHKIVVVPTIIVFNEKEEVKRFQANIMMQLEASKEDVQEAVDEIIMSAF